MKKRLSLLLLSCCCLTTWTAFTGHAQSADDLVTQGRQLWTAGKMNDAHVRFAAAVVASPGHETANALYAVTRLLVLPERPAVKSLLDRLGLESTNRLVLDWTAGLPEDTNGVPLAPAGMSAQEAVNLLRTELLPELAAAATNLARVNSPGFLLTLTEEETERGEMTLDLGDVRLLRAGLHFAGYWGHTLNSWNFDAQLTTIRAFALDEDRSLEQFLNQLPGLLAYSPQADLAASRTEFSRFVENYLAASDVIRGRATGLDRLFNWDPESTADEAAFREKLLALRDSLTSPTAWPGKPDITVDLGRHFSGGGALRDWLPQLQDNAVVLGTLPVPVLGGALRGRTGGQIEREVIDAAEQQGLEIATVSHLARPVSSPAGNLAVSVSTLTGRSYLFETSLNFTNWFEISRFVAQAAQTVVTLPVSNERHAFFRLVELGSPANDNLAQPATLAGTDLVFHQRVSWATYETNEPDRNGSGSIWWEWTAPESGWVTLDDTDGDSFLTAYEQMGFSLASLARVSFPDLSYGRAFFRAEAGRAYLIRSVLSFWGGAEFVRLRLQLRPPPPNDNFANATLLAGKSVRAAGYLVGASLEAGEPVQGNPPPTRSIWWRWVAPADGRFRVVLAGETYSPTTLVVYVGASPASLGRTPTGGSKETAIEAVQGRTYHIAVVEGEGWGSPSEVGLLLEPVTPPANDNFASRIRLVGDSSQFAGSNRGSTRETGEPLHGDQNASLGGTVWWTWTAPENGMAQFNVEGDLRYSSNVAVYVGDTLASLTSAGSRSFNVTAGRTYQIALSTYAGITGPFTLLWNLSRP